MRDSAKILSIGKNGSVTVLPVIKDACISCSRTSCAKAGTPFTVMNTRSLDVKPGMTVRIAAKKSSQAVQALTALLLPVACAVGGWFAANALAATMNISSGEWLQAIGVLLGIFVPSGIIFLISRRVKSAHGEITEIVADE